jgi:hypothetical protein
MQLYDKAKSASEKFDLLIHEVLLDIPDLKQETMAIDGGVKQNAISQWLNHENGRQFPAYQLLIQQEAIVVPLCKEFVKRFGKKIVDEEFNLPINGRVEDNLLNIDVIQAEIIKLMDNDPKKAAKFCDALELQVKTTRKELESKVK